MAGNKTAEVAGPVIGNVGCIPSVIGNPLEHGNGVGGDYMI